MTAAVSFTATSRGTWRFIDPFVLFNSKKRAYRKLHGQIIEYLIFLRDKAATTDATDGQQAPMRQRMNRYDVSAVAKSLPWSVPDMPKRTYRVAIVFPADPALRRKTRLEDSRFARIAAALADKGIEVVGAAYVDDDVEVVRSQLMRVDGALVWINRSSMVATGRS
jgi:hypothetical protein